MLLKVIGIILVFVFGIGSFFTRKVLGVVRKQEIEMSEIVKWKAVMLVVVVIGACLVVMPDMLS